MNINKNDFIKKLQKFGADLKKKIKEFKDSETFKKSKKNIENISLTMGSKLPKKFAARLPERVLKYLLLWTLALALVIVVAVAAIASPKNASVKKKVSVEIKSMTAQLENEARNNMLQQSAEAEKAQQAEDENSYEVTLCAVGDNLMHTSIIYQAQQDDGSYDFKPLYEHVKEKISSYDVAVVNQETIFIDDESEISGFPYFGSPTAVGDALVDTGFDIVLHATNHVWDKEQYGIFDTINYWDQYEDIMMLGIHPDDEDYRRIDAIERNNIKMALFNYTSDMNGFPLPEDEYYLVNTWKYAEEKLLRDLENVEDDVDVSICFLHIGEEYEFEPTYDQCAIINHCIDAGADIIICSHPHVVEPYGMVTTDEGNTALVYYSCGNFISGQNKTSRMLGGMASLTLKKTVDGDESKTVVKDYDFIPLVTHYNDDKSTIYWLDDYTEELAKEHTLHYAEDDFTLEYLKKLWSGVAYEI